MASKITMPKLSDTMDQGVILKVLKKEGDRVEPGDVLAEVETDKANMELEVFEEGVIRKLFISEGDGIPVGGLVGVLAEDEDEDISGILEEARAEESGKGDGGSTDSGTDQDAEKSEDSEDSKGSVRSGGARKSGADESGPAPSRTGAGAPATAGREDGRVLASPVARKLAAEKGLDLARIQGSGPSGRVIKRDVVAAAEAGPAASPVAPAGEGPSVTEVPMTSMMQIVARRMVESKFQAPHFYVTMDIGMDRAVELREELKAAERKLSFNDLVLKAVAAALERVPALNATFEDGRLRRYRDADVGFAVAFEGGLITPVVRSANRKGLGAIAAETRELISRAKEKKLKPEEYTGGTFTVSNMGMYGIEDFTAIINTPQVGILAVGGIRHEPVVVGGTVVPGRRMKVTLSTDHRAANGADAAEFLAALREVLETPSLLLW